MDKIIVMLFDDFYWLENSSIEKIEKFGDILSVLLNADIAKVFEVLAINNDDQDGFSSEELLGMLDASYQKTRNEVVA